MKPQAPASLAQASSLRALSMVRNGSSAIHRRRPLVPSQSPASQRL